MDEQTKKYLVIGIAVACLSVAGALFYRSFFGDSSGGGDTGDRQIALMCASCDGFEVSVDEFSQMMSQQGSEETMAMPGQTPVMKCPKCGKKTCYMAQKCPKCQAIFVPGQAKDRNYADRCPKCSFSATEDRRKNRTP